MDTSDPTTPIDDFDNVLLRRNSLIYRHAQGLTHLMGQREDLRGVHAMADLVDDAIRWTA